MGTTRAPARHAGISWKVCLVVCWSAVLPFSSFGFTTQLPAFGATLRGSQRCDRVKPAAGASCTAVRPRLLRAPKGDWGKIAVTAEQPKRPPLPRLTPKEEEALAQGKPVHKQTRTGRIGQGLSVVDVHADVATAVAVLTDLDRYQERISTVKEAHIIQRGTRKCKARFKLSRFRLEVAVEFAMNRERNMLDFRLDPEATTAAFDQARGFWYVEETPHRPGHCRIFLSAKLVCSPLLPSFIVDYAATKALPKATCWLKPVIEGIARGLPAGAVDVHGVDHRTALLKPTANEASEIVPAAIHPEWHPPQEVN